MVTPIQSWFGGRDARVRDKALSAAVALTFFCLPLGTAPMLIAGGLTMAVWLFSGIAWSARRIYTAPDWWPVYAMILLPWIGLLYTVDTYGLGWAYAGKTYYWLAGLAAAATALQRFSPTLPAHAFLAGLALNVVAAILQVVLHLPDKHNYHLGLGPPYSTLSAYLIVGMMMTAYFLAREGEARRKAVYTLLLLLYFFHLVLMPGRTGYITLMLMLPVMGFTYFKQHRVLKTALVLVLVPGLMLLSPVVRQRAYTSADQLQSQLDTQHAASWDKEDRFFLWSGALKIIRANPWIGVGTGGYQTALKALDPTTYERSHPHNNFLHMLVSFGVVGLAVLLWFLYTTIRNGWCERRSAAGYLLLSTMLVMTAGGLSNTQILDVGTAFMVSLCVGLQTGFTATQTVSPAELGK